MKKLRLHLIATCILTLGFVYIAAPLAHADITTGLVGHWKFDEANSGTCSGTTADSSGSGNTGTCQSSPTYVAGKIGLGALSFNGTTQYVSAGNPSSLKPTSYTVSAWVKYDSSNPSTYGTIVGFVGSGSGYELVTDPSNGEVWWANSGNFNINYIPAFTLTNGVWTLLTWAYDETSGNRIYANGTQIFSDSGTGANTYSGTVDFNIGTRGDDTGTFTYKGGIDDVCVYNRALSAQDVTDLYNSATGCTAAAPPTAATFTPFRIFLGKVLRVFKGGYFKVQ